MKHDFMHQTAIWIALAGIQSMLQFGCNNSGAGAQASGEPKGLVFEAEAAGTRAALAADDLLTVRLPAQTSAGYTWDIQDLDQSVLKLEVRERQMAPILGGTDTEVLRFKGVGKGTAAIKLAYHRPWAQESADTQTFAARVDVPGAYTGVYSRPKSTSKRALSAQELTVAGVPSAYKICDGNGGCTPVRNQASCGDCWAFATAGVFENLLALSNNASYDLSEQYLTSCNSEGWGCNGGFAAFDYYVNKHVSSEGDAGAVYEGDDPFVSGDGNDRACGSAHPHHEKLQSWAYVNGSAPSVAGYCSSRPKAFSAAKSNPAGSPTFTSMPSGRARVRTTSIVWGWQPSAMRNVPP